MPKLVVLQGPNVHAEFPLERDKVTLGRDQACEIYLGGTKSSRNHAQIFKRGDRFCLRDLGSRNGTFRNGTKVTGDVELASGDMVAVGDMVLQFVADSTGAAAGSKLPAPLAVKMRCPHCGSNVRGKAEQFALPVICPKCKVLGAFVSAQENPRGDTREFPPVGPRAEPVTPAAEPAIEVALRDQPPPEAKPPAPAPPVPNAPAEGIAPTFIELLPFQAPPRPPEIAPVGLPFPKVQPKATFKPIPIPAIRALTKEPPTQPFPPLPRRKHRTAFIVMAAGAVVVLAALALFIRPSSISAEKQVALGRSYLTGRGKAKDEAEAVKWFRRAAEQGNVEGQMQLGQCYLKGTGVPQDRVEAEKWYRLAADQGDETAQDVLKNMPK